MAIRALILWIVLVLTSGSVLAQGAAAPGVLTSVELANGVRMYGHVTYATEAGYRPLTMDIYVPSTPGPHPAVLYFHGGGWQAGNPRGGPAWGQDWQQTLSGFVARGFVVAGVSYRFTGETTFPGQIQDVYKAIRWIRSEGAERFGVDPDRVGLWGASAGAQMVMLAALDCESRALEQPTAPAEPSTCVSAVAEYYGPSDFLTIAEQGSVVPWHEPTGLDSVYLNCPTTPCPRSMLEWASPVNYVHADAPPFLIVHGDADRIVSLQQSQLFQQALRAQGNSAELHIVPNGDHGFPGASEADIDRALARTFAFFEEHLGN